MITFLQKIKGAMLAQKWTPQRSNAVELIDEAMDKAKEASHEGNAPRRR